VFFFVVDLERLMSLCDHLAHLLYRPEPAQMIELLVHLLSYHFS
jgi:hypothetical protein